MLDAQATLREPEARYIVCRMHHTREVAKGGFPDLGIPPPGVRPHVTRGGQKSKRSARVPFDGVPLGQFKKFIRNGNGKIKWISCFGHLAFPNPVWRA